LPLATGLPCKSMLIAAVQPANVYYLLINHSRQGAFNFSKATLPLLLKAVDKSEHPPTLIFTGATASVKANAFLSSFNSSNFAKRALSSALAKEFGPKGVHVSHAIIDGVIDIPRTKGYLKDAGPDAKISADAVSCSSMTFKIKR